MLAAELAGEVDGGTALLIDYADMPHMPRLIAKGMEKAVRDGPTALKVASPDEIGRLPTLPIIDKGENGGRKLDMSQMKPGQHYRTADGGVMLYDGEALVTVKVESKSTDPAGPNTPTPPLPLGKASPERERAVKGIAHELDEQGNPSAVDVDGEGICDLEADYPRLPSGLEDEETDLEPAGPFEGFTRKKQQAANGMFIIGQIDEIAKSEAGRRGERTGLLETPRQREMDEAAPPSGKPGIADMTEEEWRERESDLRHRLGKRVESFSRNYRELEKEFGSVDFFDDPEYATLHALDKAGEKAIDGAPLVLEQYRLLVLTLREFDVDPGDPEAVMEALYDEEFRALLDERRNEWVGNTVANAVLKEARDVEYDGGKPPPVEGGAERKRPQGAKAQTQRLPDKLANAGYATEVDNIMMEVFTLRNIEEGARPDQLMPPRLAEQHRDRLPGDETALDRYASLPPYPRAATNNALVDRLAKALKNQGGVRKRLKASEARPGVVDDPVGALARIVSDGVAAVPNTIPGVAQVIGANESFYKTVAEFGVDTENYRAMAELALTPEFAMSWKKNYDRYLVKALGKIFVSPFVKAGIGKLKDTALDGISE